MKDDMWAYSIYYLPCLDNEYVGGIISLGSVMKDDMWAYSIYYLPCLDN